MWAIDGTWKRVFTALLAQADADANLSWLGIHLQRPTVTAELSEPQELGLVSFGEGLGVMHGHFRRDMPI